MFLRVGRCCPRYAEYQLLFVDSAKLQRALCTFYATIIEFCTKAVQTLNQPITLTSVLTQALWRPFEKEFGKFESDLGLRSEEVKEEIKLAGYIATVSYQKSGSRFRKEARGITKQDRERRLQKDLQRAGKLYVRSRKVCVFEEVLT